MQVSRTIGIIGLRGVLVLAVVITAASGQLDVIGIALLGGVASGAVVCLWPPQRTQASSADTAPPGGDRDEPRPPDRRSYEPVQPSDRSFRGPSQPPGGATGTRIS